jgi:hypothetical protein
VDLEVECLRGKPISCLFLVHTSASTELKALLDLRLPLAALSVFGIACGSSKHFAATAS